MEPRFSGSDRRNFRIVENYFVEWSSQTGLEASFCAEKGSLTVTAMKPGDTGEPSPKEPKSRPKTAF